MTTKGEQNRDLIVNAANTLFYQNGVAVTSLADISRESGVPKGNFYFYFKSKDEILLAVMNDRIAQTKEMLSSWEEEHDKPLDRLHRFAKMPLNDWVNVVQYGCPIGTICSELGKGDSQFRELPKTIFSIIVKWSETQFKALGFPTAKARAHSRHLMLRMQGAVTLGHAFHDTSWIKEELKNIHQWIDDVQLAAK